MLPISLLMTLISSKGPIVYYVLVGGGGGVGYNFLRGNFENVQNVRGSKY